MMRGVRSIANCGRITEVTLLRDCPVRNWCLNKYNVTRSPESAGVPRSPL
jgi:hypothetical protein